MAAQLNYREMSTEDLDEILRLASEARAERTGEQLPEPIRDAPICMNPAWRVTDSAQGAWLALLHPGFGWLQFILPPKERAHILTLLLYQALVPMWSEVGKTH